MSETVYIGLGTNLGERSRNLAAARACLEAVLEDVAVSSIYETDPWGYADQPPFLNQILRGSTRWKPARLLAYLKHQERRIGRRPTFRFGPRLIDMDILLFGSLIFTTRRLTIPHPRLAERAFVLVPLAELAPDLLVPGRDASIRQLLADVDTGGVRLFQPPR